jgi:hypothetical protein
MTSDNSKRIKLAGTSARTTSSVEIKDDGDLIVEFYDFSADAHKSLGRDVAFIVTVAANDKEDLLRRLLIGEPMDNASALNNDDLLLSLLEKRFKSFFEIKEFLKNANIPFKEAIDDWA